MVTVRVSRTTVITNLIVTRAASAIAELFVKTCRGVLHAVMYEEVLFYEICTCIEVWKATVRNPNIALAHMASRSGGLHSLSVFRFKCRLLRQCLPQAKNRLLTASATILTLYSAQAIIVPHRMI